MANYARPPEVYEVFEKVAKLKTVKEKADYLRAQDQRGLAVRDVCQAAHDPRVVFLLPEGKIPYESASEESHPTSLSRKHRDFQYFVKCPVANKMPAYKRESIFLQMMEGIHPKDAKVMENVIAKKNPAPGITKALVKKAWPELGIE